MIVRENLNFERGLDPKVSMKIGRLGKRAMDKMKPGIIYCSNFYWFFRDPKNNKIYKVFGIAKGYKIHEWGCYENEKDENFPLDLEPSGIDFDEIYRKIVSIENKEISN